MARTGYLPARICIKGHSFLPADFLAAAARTMSQIFRGAQLPEPIRIRPAVCRFEDFVEQAAAAQAAKGATMKPGFAAPKLYELAKVVAWTLKPAILRPQG